MITTEKVLWETESVPLINITRSWEWVDCGVNPYKHSLNFKNGLQYVFESFDFWYLLSGVILPKFQIHIFFFAETRAILLGLVGEILPRCENAIFFIILVFDVLPNKIDYGWSFAFPAGFLIISHDVARFYNQFW